MKNSLAVVTGCISKVGTVYIQWQLNMPESLIHHNTRKIKKKIQLYTLEYLELSLFWALLSLDASEEELK